MVSMCLNNLSHLVLSWWSKETAMMINFVLDSSSQTFLAHLLIDLHKRSHFELQFRFFRTYFGFESLDGENLSHFFSSYHHWLLKIDGFLGTCRMNSAETPCNLKLRSSFTQKSAMLSKEIVAK